MINITVSPNERLSGRTEMMIEATKYFKKGEFHEVEEKDIDCDVLFEEDGKKYAIEVKTVKDFYSSFATDRFCSQILGFIEDSSPCAIIVMGSFDDVMDTAYEQRLNFAPEKIKKIAQDRLAECYGLYIPVLFLSSKPLTSYIFLLQVAQKVLRGGCVAGMVPKPDKAMRRIAMLCLIKGVGEKTANAVMKEYGSLYNLVTDIKTNFNRLLKVKVGGKCISSDTAKNIANVFS